MQYWLLVENSLLNGCRALKPGGWTGKSLCIHSSNRRECAAGAGVMMGLVVAVRGRLEEPVKASVEWPVGLGLLGWLCFPRAAWGAGEAQIDPPRALPLPEQLPLPPPRLPALPCLGSPLPLKPPRWPFSAEGSCRRIGFSTPSHPPGAWQALHGQAGLGHLGASPGSQP